MAWKQNLVRANSIIIKNTINGKLHTLNKVHTIIEPINWKMTLKVPLTAKDNTFELSNSLLKRLSIFPLGIISWNKFIGAFINFWIKVSCILILYFT